MAPKDDVIAEYPAAHAIFQVTEERMPCPATWAIYSGAGEK
jgi:hypothetical protein